jgi:DMSO/TMAO reductase YedYZ molybdopterin-dependent catalytic subunit
MKKMAKIVIVVFVLLIVAVVPLYYYSHPTNTQENTIQVIGNVDNPLNLTLSQLETITSVTIQATLTSSGSPQDNGVFNYTGVTLKAVLGLVQASDNATAVYIQASDGYGTTITIQDAMNQNTIIAYAKDGSPLNDLKNGGEGPVRLVIGDDQYSQRWVKGVISIEIT